MFMLDPVKGLAHGCKLTEMSSNSADPLNSAEHFSVSQLIILVSLPSNFTVLINSNQNSKALSSQEAVFSCD